MKRANAEAQEALRFFGALLPKLWNIALGKASHNEVTTRSLFLVAAGFLNAADAGTRFVCESGLRRAYGLDDRQELAKETLKIIRCALGWGAVDGELKIYDQRSAFSQIRAKVTRVQFEAMWNAPGMQHLTARERAKKLERQGYGAEDAIERRARRMRKQGFELHGVRKRKRPRKRTRDAG